MMMNSKMTHQTTPPLAGEIEGIRERHKFHSYGDGSIIGNTEFGAQAHRDRATLLAVLEAADELNARLKLEAQCHAQEARAANATVHEIYQVISGATGEPGNWNGAEPVKAYVAKAHERIGILEHELDLNEREQLDADDDAALDAKKLKAAQERIAGLTEALEYWVEAAQYDQKYAAWLGKARAALALPSPGTKGEVGT